MRDIGNVMQWSAQCREHFFPWRAKAESAEHGEHIAEAGITEACAGYLLERRSPRFHLLLYTLEGTGLVYGTTREWTVQRGQVLIVPAGVSFGYHPKDERWRFIWLHLPPSERWHHLGQRGITVRHTVMVDPLE